MYDDDPRSDSNQSPALEEPSPPVFVRSNGQSRPGVRWTGRLIAIGALLYLASMLLGFLGVSWVPPAHIPLAASILSPSPVAPTLGGNAPEIRRIAPAATSSTEPTVVTESGSVPADSSGLAHGTPGAEPATSAAPVPGIPVTGTTVPQQHGNPVATSQAGQPTATTPRATQTSSPKQKTVPVPSQTTSPSTTASHPGPPASRSSATATVPAAATTPVRPTSPTTATHPTTPADTRTTSGPTPNDTRPTHP